MCRCSCGCGPGHHREGSRHGRRFLTKTERVEHLKGYVEDLKKEITAVEEHIKEISS